MKILVIQQKMIGDVLISSLICENIKRNFPDAEVHYLINTFTKPVVDGNPFVDKFVIFEDLYRESKSAFYTFLKSIKQENYTHVVDAYGKLESNLISLFSKAPFKVSYHKNYTSWIYTTTYKELTEPVTEAGIAIDYRLKLLETLGDLKIYNSKPKIYLSTQEKETAALAFQKHGLNAHETIMISALGSGLNKTYPLEYMAKVIDTVASKTQSSLIFNYMPKQKDEVQRLYDLCTLETQKRIHLDLTANSLRDLMAISSQCQAVIGNEGGAINIAKALDVPSFAIFSPWIFKEGWNSFEKSYPNASVHLSDYKPELCKDSKSELKQKSLELYQEFKPDFFTTKLSEFITNHII